MAQFKNLKTFPLIALAIITLLPWIQTACSAAEPTDYVNSLGGTVDYWHAEKMPLKVLIVDGSKIPNCKSLFKDYFTAACKTWSDASKGKVTFTFVTAEPCDIKVSWTNDMSQLNQQGELGESKWENDQTGLYYATIKLLTVGPDGRRPISNAEAKLMCLHELGHSLGLVKHSPFLGDIMNACVDFNYNTPVEQLGLSERDKNTIARLYAEGDTLVDQLAAESTDPKVKLVRLCFRAAKLMQTDHYDAAYILLERAIKIDPNCGPALNAMANCCFEQGMDLYSAGNYEAAIARFERFLAIAAKIKLDIPEVAQARESIARCKTKLQQAPKK